MTLEPFCLLFLLIWGNIVLVLIILLEVVRLLGWAVVVALAMLSPRRLVRLLPVSSPPSDDGWRDRSLSALEA